jgi:3-oxoacyl-[acyl-carrier protein] reductase
MAFQSELLAGKVAFITGSSRGIGWSTARVFAAHGAIVILNGQSADALRKRSDELTSEFKIESLTLPGDVSDPAVVRSFYSEIFKRFKRLDILVNNAGILRDGLLGMIPTELVERTLAVNVAGAIYNLQEASRLMSRKKAGSIVNISSIIGRVGNEGQAVYGASKAAVIGLTLSAAKELAANNIRVNAVAPGFIETDMTRQLPSGKQAERLASIKMKRVGSPEDIANTALFLASDLSAYITGQVIGVDGGMLI